MLRPRLFAPLIVLALLASACNIHIVGDSTAYLVQAYTAEAGGTITGTPTLHCGYTPMNGNRTAPSQLDGPGYPSCVTDWTGVPDAPDDTIFAFVSIHDAMCSTIDGCLAVDASPYTQVHADLVAMGNAVVWIEVPPIGDTTMQARIHDLNAAVSAAIGCTLEPYSIREAPTWDGLHYFSFGALLVALRLLIMANANPAGCR